MLIFTFLLTTNSFSHTVSSCGSPATNDIKSAIHAIKNRWSNYERFVKNFWGFNNLSTCLEKRFKSKGKVKCKNLSGNKVGLAYPGFKEVKIDKGWLAGLSSNENRRRACIAALVAHEFAHTCFSSERRSDKIDEATFEWWKDRFSNSNSWESCGIYL